MSMGVRVGMIVPSSNTVLEEELARLAPCGGPVAVHVTRVRVTQISMEAPALAQFDVGPMSAAAALLGDAMVSAVAWAGTAGAWLGLGHDRMLAERLAEAAGAPATTSTLALVAGCHEQGVERVGLITPYTRPVVERIIATLAREGLTVTAERHLGLTMNHSFAGVEPSEIARMASDCAVPGVQALVVLCTNMRGGQAAAWITEQTGLPVLDSVAVTLAGAVATGAGAEP